MTTADRRRLANQYRKAGIELLRLSAELDPAAYKRKIKQAHEWAIRDIELSEYCHELWVELFCEPWPKDVQCRYTKRSEWYYGWAEVGGATHGGDLLISWKLNSQPDTLRHTVLHEFAHLRGFEHGKEMDAAVEKWEARLSKPSGGYIVLP